jgi:hypothetical protein
VTPPSVAAKRDSTAPSPENLLLPAKEPARHAPARADRPFRGIALILLSTVFL